MGGYHGVLLFLLVLSACGSALAFHLAHLATGGIPAAWFGWAAVTLSATAIFHSFTVYPDGLGGVVALTGVWALFRAERGACVGRRQPASVVPARRCAGDAALDAQQVCAARRKSRRADPAAPGRYEEPGGEGGGVPLGAGSLCALLDGVLPSKCTAVPIHRRPTERPAIFRSAFVPGGLTGLLFDQRFGLVANAPVLLFGFVGLALMFRLPRRSAPSHEPAGLADRRLAIELLFVVVPYLLTATSYAMWWAGWSAPARFANPAVFLLAIPCAVMWADLRHRATKTVAAGSLVLTAFLSVVLVTTDGGRLAYNTRETTALWLDWASSLVALGEGLPVWYRGREGTFARDVIIWAAVFLLAQILARTLAGVRSLRDQTRYATAVAALLAVAAMCAITIVWRLKGNDGLAAAPAQLDLLRRHARDVHGLAVQVTPPRLLEKRRLLTMLRLESEPRVVGGRGRPEQPLVSLPAIPAGRYRVSTRTRGPGGWVFLGIGQDQFALRSEPLAYPPVPLEIDFPVDVRALIVKGDEDARRTVRTVAIEPLSLVPPDARLTDRIAGRAVKYQTASVFFLDDGCFPEPDAFWVGGARQGTFVVQSARQSASVPFHVRNAPVENQVTLESGQWREALTLAPGEERYLEVPVAPGRGAAMVTMTSRSGFRPSESVQGSRDERFLGVWVSIGRE